MKDSLLLFSLVLWVLSVTKPGWGPYVYALWIPAFALMYLGWSLFFAVTAGIAAISFRFADLSSGGMLASTVLPWTCGITVFVIFISLVVRYARYLGGSAYRDSSNAVFFDSGSDGGDDGC